MNLDGMRDRARQGLRAGGFVGITATMLPLYLAHRARVEEDQRELIRDLWVRRWSRALLGLFEIEVVVDGTVPPPTRRGDRGRLVVSNHRSAIDIGVLLSTVGGTMVSRADLADWPLVGAAARSVGTVFVDRKNAQSGASTIRTIQKHLEDGQTIVLFPEGTTFDGDAVRPFHGGAFIAAVRAGAEILPAGIAYPKTSGAAFVSETFPAHLGRLAKSNATRMVLAVGAPFVTNPREKAGIVTSRAHEAVRELVKKARARCGDA